MFFARSFKVLGIRFWQTFNSQSTLMVVLYNYIVQNRLGGGWFLVMINKPAFVKANEERYWQKEKVAMAWLTVRD